MIHKQLTEPLISLEVVFVLSMILVTFIGVFVNDYDGNILSFVTDLVAQSNVIMTFVLFTLLVSVQLVVHLFALLKPFQEQKAHEAWVEKMSLWLRIEEANLYRVACTDETKERKCEKEAKAIQNTRELLTELKTEMAENRAAPKLLGVVPLNESLIQTIITAIGTAMTAFASSFFTGVLSDITGTESPTPEPTSL